MYVDNDIKIIGDKPSVDIEKNRKKEKDEGIIPKSQITLGQFKLLQVQFLGNTLTQYIGRGKQPATAAVFLIGNRQRLEFNGKFLLHFPCRFVDKGNRIDIRLGQCQRCQLPYGTAVILLRPRAQEFLCYRVLLHSISPSLSGMLAYCCSVCVDYKPISSRNQCIPMTKTCNNAYFMY